MVVTISHGALDTLGTLRHKGLIAICDIDPGVIESAGYMVTDYPDLRFRAHHGTIQDTVQFFLDAFGPAIFANAVVDVDLADTMVTCFPIVQEVLQKLVDAGAHTKVLFTFRNGRDNTKGVNNRLSWLQKRVPRGVKINRHFEYNSLRINAYAGRETGSCMCVAELQT